MGLGDRVFLGGRDQPRPGIGLRVPPLARAEKHGPAADVKAAGRRHARDRPAERPQPQRVHPGHPRDAVGPCAGGIQDDAPRVPGPVRCRDAPTGAVARDRRDTVARVHLAAVGADRPCEMLHHPVGVDVPGRLVIARAGHVLRMDDRDARPRLLGRYRDQRHRVDIRLRRRFLARPAKQQQAAR
jgi:hypothetical protein